MYFPDADHSVTLNDYVYVIFLSFPDVDRLCAPVAVAPSLSPRLLLTSGQGKPMSLLLLNLLNTRISNCHLRSKQHEKRETLMMKTMMLK